MNFKIDDTPEGRYVELPALKLIQALGYKYLSNFEINQESERSDHRQVLLYPRLKQALKRLNTLDDEGIDDAIRQIHEDSFPGSLPIVDANERIRIKLIGRSIDDSVDQPITVKQYGKNGLEYITVRFFDFDNPENNEFLVTNQFYHFGNRTEIEVDIMIFVNGIPLVLVECKQPSSRDFMKEAWESNLEKYQDERFGHQKLFFYNHIIIATCDFAAKYGTVGYGPNNYSKWSKSYSLTDEELEKLTGRPPTPQDILLADLLNKKTLLDMLKNFVIYETDKNKKIKKVAKHQQYRVVTRSVERLQQGKNVKDKGGVIWHTQGSGKSLSMVWFATQLLYKFGNPPIMIVTDRVQLNDQINKTFKNCGFPDPEKPNNRKHLAELLKNPKGKTIMVNLQKFGKPKDFVHTKERIYVLVDEAHRSQYKFSASHMRAAMPNGVFFAFTGTPIDKKNRTTYGKFGPLIDKYSFEESKADGATLRVKYEGRLPELAIEGGNSINEIFDRLCDLEKLNIEQRAELKAKYARKSKIAEAPARIRTICKDLINHFNTKIAPNGYKGMIVASSREAAVTYKRELDKLGGPQSRIIMDSKLDEIGKDGTSWAPYYLDERERLRKSEEFKTADDQTKFLIVVDMLLVGYDVPIVQVMYLDKPLKEHALLQAIARVNRLYDERKDYGLIIDYIGVTKNIQDALKIFEEQDVEGAFDSLDDDLIDLDNRHKEFLSVIKDVELTYDSISKRFQTIDEQENFEYAFKMFAKSLEAVLPDKTAVPYEKDFKFGCEIRSRIRTAFYGDKPNMREYGKKVQQLIDDHIRSLGIKELMEPREITFENFLAFASTKLKDTKAKAALVKNKAMQVIRELSPSNPVYYEKLRERLEKLIQEEKNHRIDDAGYFDQLSILYDDALSGPQRIKNELGISDEFELAVYLLIEFESHDKELCKNYAKEITTQVKQITSIKDWKDKPKVVDDIYLAVYDPLDPEKFTKQIRDKLANEVIKLARYKFD